MTKKKKKPTIKKLRNKLWELCKKTVRTRDGNICVICGKNGLEGSGWHTGHFIPSSTCGTFLRYDLRNLHSSCYNCNINLGGNGALFYKVLVAKFGQGFVDKIFQSRNRITKNNIAFYQTKIAEYNEIQGWNKIELLDYTKKIGE